MTEENAERLRVFIESWSGGEPEALDLSLLDPDVVFEDTVYFDHGGSYHGHEGVLRAARAWLEAYDPVRIELERIAGSGDRLVSIHRFLGTGRRSGIKHDFGFAYLWIFRDGKVVHFRSFPGAAEALAALDAA